MLKTGPTQAHEACGPMEIDSALTAIQNLRSELQDAKAAAAGEQLKPLPGESVMDVSALNAVSLVSLVIKKLLFSCRFDFSWRNVLRIWAAPPRPWVRPWRSSSRAPHREMSTTQVSAGGPNDAVFQSVICNISKREREIPTSNSTANTA